MNDTSQNPYVGPRSFQEADSHNFFGRDIEGRQLTSLIIAHRVVLFYAQSGAGKTSLLQASVVPALKRRRMVGVLPVTRVGGDLPPGIAGNQVKNIYVFNAVLNLEKIASPPENLVELSLPAGLQPHLQPEKEGQRPYPHLLILDQFEELFTHHTERYQERADFFSQLRDCLEIYPYLSLLLAMREEHIAELDFYSAQLPDRLRTRFRIEFMTRESALEAVKEPASQAGRPFEHGVAEELVDNLRRIQVSRAAEKPGAEHVAIGKFVEPVHLQIVCHQLWESLPADGETIRSDDVRAFGNVDQALALFYEDVIRSVSRQAGVSQRRLRTWFDEQLITPAQTRGLVFSGDRETAGLANEVVDRLNRAYLIRSEIRHGAPWYELSHDRFIAPIQRSNQEWRAARQVRLIKSVIGAGLLILLAVISVAISVQATTDAVVEATATASAAESSDLALSVARSRVRPLRPGLGVSGAMASAGTIGAFARSGGNEVYVLIAGPLQGAPGCESGVPLLQPGQADGGQAPDDVIGFVSRCLRIENGVPISNMVGLTRVKEDLAFETSIPGIGPVRGVREPEIDDPVRMLGRSSGLVSGKITGLPAEVEFLFGDGITYQFTNAIVTTLMSAAGDEGALVVDEQGYAVGILVDSSRNSALLAPIGEILDGLGVELLQTVTQLARLVSASAVMETAWSPDGERLAAGSKDGTARVWEVTSGQEVARMYHDDRVTSIAFSPDGAWVASGDFNGAFRVWEAASGRQVARMDHNGIPLAWRLFLERGGWDMERTIFWNSVAFSPDGKWVISGSGDGTARVWEAASGQEVARMTHDGPVFSVAFSPDGKWVVSGSTDGVRVWEAARGLEVAPMTYESWVTSVAFSPDGQWVVSGSGDGTARVWEAASGREIARMTHENWVTSVAFSPDGQWVVSGSDDGTARVWEAASGREIAPMTYESWVTSVAFSPDGRLAYAGDDGVVNILLLVK